jgi:prolipoprotein diacylglyceryl transferase
MIDFIQWKVNPAILKTDSIEIRWYGLLFALAFLVSYYIIKNMFKRENISQDLLDKLTIYVGVGTVVGARLGHVLFYQPEYYAKHLLEVFQIWKGGLASHGAAIGILVALWLFVRKYKKPYPT